VNEPQILYAAQITKETKNINEHQILKDDQIYNENQITNNLKT
jgi:hypothetical protein